MLFKTKKSVHLDLHDLMIGAEDSQGLTIIDHLTGGEFLESDPDLSIEVGQHIGRVVTGAVVNSMWEYDRTYFVLADSPKGCEEERKYDLRGPTEYLVCLPEFRDKAFWLFSIDRYHEYDVGRDDQAQVRGPTGFFRLDGNGNSTFLI